MAVENLALKPGHAVSQNVMVKHGHTEISLCARRVVPAGGTCESDTQIVVRLTRAPSLVPTDTPEKVPKFRPTIVTRASAKGTLVGYTALTVGAADRLRSQPAPDPEW